jgi:hypothetical protein
MKNGIYYNDSQLKIIEALSIFKYLTASKIISLGIFKHSSSVSNAIKLLKQGIKPLVWEITFGLKPWIQRLEKVFYLTRYGADFLVDHLKYDPWNIRYPRGHILFRQDYFHRLSVVDFQIWLYKYIASMKPAFIKFYTYFDKAIEVKGIFKTAEPLTKLYLGEKGSIISDAECHFRLKKCWLCPEHWDFELKWAGQKLWAIA